MKLIVLLMLTAGAFGVDIGAVQVEAYDWLRYVRDGETTKDQLQRSGEALEKLDARYAEVHDAIVVRLTPENAKLFHDSEVRWKEYRNYTAYFLGSRYEGGTMKGPYVGCVMIRMTMAHIADLVGYEEEYFKP